MLKGISSLLSPELLYMLAQMGHGDELVLGDGNFPSCAMGQRVVHAEGNQCCEMLDAILQLMPLDDFVDAPVTLMQVVPGKQECETPAIWQPIRSCVEQHEPGKKIGYLDRASFYERAQKAFAVVQTSETALYACVILTKGVLRPDEESK